MGKIAKKGGGTDEICTVSVGVLLFFNF